MQSDIFRAIGKKRIPVMATNLRNFPYKLQKKFLNFPQRPKNRRRRFASKKRPVIVALNVTMALDLQK